MTRTALIDAAPPSCAPVAILNEKDILQAAAAALQEQERLRVALRALDEHLRTLCRQFDAASGTRGIQPYHLRHACEARGMLP